MEDQTLNQGTRRFSSQAPQRSRTTAATTINTANNSAMMATTTVDRDSGDAPTPCSSSTIFFAQLIMAERIRPHQATSASSRILVCVEKQAQFSITRSHHVQALSCAMQPLGAFRRSSHSGCPPAENTLRREVGILRRD
jgi:hypothetical protein